MHFLTHVCSAAAWPPAWERPMLYLLSLHLSLEDRAGPWQMLSVECDALSGGRWQRFLPCDESL